MEFQNAVCHGFGKLISKPYVLRCNDYFSRLSSDSVDFKLMMDPSQTILREINMLRL